MRSFLAGFGWFRVVSGWVQVVSGWVRVVSGRFWLGSGGFGSFRVSSDGFGWVRVVSGFINNALLIISSQIGQNLCPRVESCPVASVIMMLFL